MSVPAETCSIQLRMKCWTILLLIPFCLTNAQDDVPNEPVVAAASNEGAQAIETFRLAPGVKAELVAAEPLVANIVAFAIDDADRIYVCETFRQEVGVTDNRSHDETWVDHDLASSTVDDRIAYHRALLPNGGADYTREQDRIRRLRDSNGDGTFDESVVFADRFHALEDGTGAGALPIEGGLLFTCIPHLWKLSDRDGDGRAEARQKLLSGFGVRVAFRGHDLHGLIRGPDGRIYFSVGDRGYHVVSHEGKRLADAESGAVFRCEPDGSALEVFATGLRNPQELAFDQFGNLFTGDNNSDSGDRARWVYVVEGGDSGWRMAYQYLPDRGPFNREKIWHPFHRQQPAYIVPPIANIGDGPSGLAYYPGTGFSPDFTDCFFMCDFRGTPGDSGIRAIRNKPAGAFFEIAEQTQPVWQILATDLAFGPNGYLYVSDWVSGWVGEGKGRIYRFANASTVESPEVSEVHMLLSSGIRTSTSEQLAAKLGHPDQRVRLEAQFELVRRAEVDLLAMSTQRGRPLLARVHGMWGLGQLARITRRPELVSRLAGLVQDDDPEIRAQVCRLLGDHHIRTAECRLLERLRDSSARVRAAAAISLGKIQSQQALCPLLDVLAENDDRDPVLRHAAIMGLGGINPECVCQAARDCPSVAVRRAAVVALRRLKSPWAARFLTDSESLVAEESARAIHDLPIPAAAAELARESVRFPKSVAFTHRSLNANYRIGDDQAAERVVKLSIDSKSDPLMRREALAMLTHWAAPSPRDRVLGMWRPIPSRSAEPAAKAVAAHWSEILASGDDDLIGLAVDSVGELRIQAAETALRQLIDESGRPAELRARAIRSLAVLNPARIEELALAAARGESPEIRIEGLRALASVNSPSTIEILDKALESPHLRERQAAFALLATLSQTAGEPLVAGALDRLLAGKIPGDTRLDVVQCAKAWANRSDAIRASEAKYEALASDAATASFRDCLEGGDAKSGRQIFFERVQVYCARCHRVGEQGGAVGPDLSDIGAKKDRQYLMESIVDPNRAIAEKFETAVIITDVGKTISGIVQTETEDFVRLTTAEGNLITVAQSAIDERRRGKSAMPEDLAAHLTPADVRDLVEFLKLQTPAGTTAESTTEK